jgi:hypothetical protein
VFRPQLRALVTHSTGGWNISTAWSARATTATVNPSHEHTLLCCQQSDFIPDNKSYLPQFDVSRDETLAELTSRCSRYSTRMSTLHGNHRYCNSNTTVYRYSYTKMHGASGECNSRILSQIGVDHEHCRGILMTTTPMVYYKTHLAHHQKERLMPSCHHRPRVP